MLHEAPDHDAVLADFREQFAAFGLVAEQRVAAAAEQPEGLLVQRRVMEPGDLDRKVPDGQVQAPVQHPFLQLRGAAHVHVQMHVMTTGNEALGGPRQGRGGVGDG
ncbi:hypothetical protein D3C85_1119840 [compost metagenome]